MSTHRLTMQMRDTIVTRMLKHRFGKQIADYYKATALFADQIYNDVLSKEDQVSIAFTPEGWLPTDNHLSANFGMSGYTNVYFGGHRYAGAEIVNVGGQPPDVYKRLPAKLKGRAVKVYDARHPLTNEFDRLNNMRIDLKDQISHTQAITRSAIKHVHTIEKLVEKWPEVTPFVADFLTAEPRLLPTVPTADLNKLLDLPVKETDNGE